MQDAAFALFSLEYFLRSGERGPSQGGLFHRGAHEPENPVFISFFGWASVFVSFSGLVCACAVYDRGDQCTDAQGAFSPSA